jgi:hypothetical protein
MLFLFGGASRSDDAHAGRVAGRPPFPRAGVAVVNTHSLPRGRGNASAWRYRGVRERECRGKNTPPPPLRNYFRGEDLRRPGARMVPASDSFRSFLRLLLPGRFRTVEPLGCCRSARNPTVDGASSVPPFPAQGSCIVRVDAHSRSVYARQADKARGKMETCMVAEDALVYYQSWPVWCRACEIYVPGDKPVKPNPCATFEVCPHCGTRVLRER